jgi:hypothetical protein
MVAQPIEHPFPPNRGLAMSHPALSPTQHQKMTTLFQHHDSDGDGALTVDDYTGVAQRFATAMGWSDGDRLGGLVARRRAAFASLGGGARISHEAFLDALAGRAKAVAGGAAPDLWLEVPELMEILAHEQFAVLTLNEYTAFLRAIGSDADPVATFQRLDRDDDGALILADLEALAGEFLASSNPDDAGNLLLCGKL